MPSVRDVVARIRAGRVRVGLVASLVAVAACLPLHIGAGSRPNIVVIIVDEMQAEAMRHAWPEWRASVTPLETPSLDRLAAEGVRLTRAYTVHGYCMPSRATMLTGLMPHAHGVRSNGAHLDPRLPRVTDALVAAGYRTYSVGKTHLTAWNLPWGKKPGDVDPEAFPEAQALWRAGLVDDIPTPYYGFQSVDFVGGHGPWMWGDYMEWLEAEHPAERERFNFDSPGPGHQTFRLEMDPAAHYNTWIADRAIARLREGVQGAERGDPFMLWVSFPDPHHPWATPEPWYSMYDRSAVPMPPSRAGELDDLPSHLADAARAFQAELKKKGLTVEEQVREVTAITYGMMSFVDQQVGRILDEIDALGIAQDTLVVFTADHGEMLGHHGLIKKGPYAFESLYKIASIWRYPGRFEAGTASGALTSNLDFAPTLLDAAGLEPFDYFSVDGADLEHYSKLDALAGRSLLPLLRGKADSLHDAIVVENDDDHIGARLRTLYTDRHQLTVYVTDDGEADHGLLFDLQEDPAQLRNLWNDPGSRALKLELKSRLLAELIRVQNRSPRLHTGF